MARRCPRISLSSPSATSTTSSKGGGPTRSGSARPPTLGGEGVEHYDGFFRSLAPADVDPIVRLMDETGQISSMLCFSPDFTHPDADERRRQVERQKAAIDLDGPAWRAALPDAERAALSGHVAGRKASRGRSTASRRSLDYAEQRDVVLCMENHYKDGTWHYPEFAQPEDIFLEIIEQIDSPHFGVQYDPSNALVGGFDPVAFLEKVKHRVVTMHASDRYLAPGATLDDLRPATAAPATPPRSSTARPARA